MDDIAMGIYYRAYDLDVIQSTYKQKQPHIHKPWSSWDPKGSWIALITSLSKRQRWQRGEMLCSTSFSPAKRDQQGTFKGSLGCSKPVMVESTILSAERDEQSKFTTVDIRRADFGLFKDLSFCFSVSPSFPKNSFEKTAFRSTQIFKV